MILSLLQHGVLHSTALRVISGQSEGGGTSPKIGSDGPLIHESQRVKVEHLIQSGRDEGARLAFGGSRPAHLPKGPFTDITLFDDVENRMAIAQEEVFGPVGGYKRSGIGREYGPDWLKEFSREKSIFYPVGR